jgi:hypothetical protein
VQRMRLRSPHDPLESFANGRYPGIEMNPLTLTQDSSRVLLLAPTYSPNS